MSPISPVSRIIDDIGNIGDIGYICMVRYPVFFRAFFLALCVTLVTQKALAQADTAVYSDGKQIPYLVAGYSGKQLPSYFITATWNGLNGTYFMEKHGLLSFGTSFMFAQLSHFTYWADGMVFLFEGSKRKSSGRIQIAEEVTGYNSATLYNMRFDGLVRTLNLGIHAGVDQTRYYGFLDPPFPLEEGEYFRAYLRSVTGFEFGFGGATRRGVSISTASGTRYRFFVCKFACDAVYYQANSIEVNGVPYILNQDAIDGSWTFDQFKYQRWGAKCMVDFYWSKTSREIPKSKPNKIFCTFHGRLGLQLLPRKEYNNVAIFCCLGFGFAIKPRYYLSEENAPGGLKPMYQSKHR